MKNQTEGQILFPVYDFFSNVKNCSVCVLYRCANVHLHSSKAICSTIIMVDSCQLFITNQATNAKFALATWAFWEKLPTERLRWQNEVITSGLYWQEMRRGKKLQRPAGGRCGMWASSPNHLSSFCSLSHTHTLCLFSQLTLCSYDTHTGLKTHKHK